LPWPDLALHDRPGDRRVDRGRGIDRPLLLELGDFLIGLAEDTQSIARGLERDLAERMSFSAASSRARAFCTSLSGTAFPS
jgi:hypothetical protein